MLLKLTPNTSCSHSCLYAWNIFALGFGSAAQLNSVVIIYLHDVSIRADKQEEIW